MLKKRKTLFMETTGIEADQTLREIEKLLTEAGATAIVKEYAAQQVAAVAFRIPRGGQDLPFRLPCRWEAIARLLAERRHDYKQAYYKEQQAKILAAQEPQAKRVAWRQILRWVQAQLALVETGMVKTEEVFMPYLQMRDGKTLFEMTEQKQFLLEGPQ